MVCKQVQQTISNNNKIKSIHQVLHLLLQPSHGSLCTDSKHERIHVLVINGHFDLLRAKTQLSVCLLQSWSVLKFIKTVCFHHLERVVLKKENFPWQCKKIKPYHLVAGGPHHPGQSVEQVLPLQKLQQPKITQYVYKSRPRKVFLQGNDVTSVTPWAGSACPRSTLAPSTTGCRCVRSPDSASRCSQVLYSCRRHLPNTHLKTQLIYSVAGWSSGHGGGETGATRRWNQLTHESEVALQKLSVRVKPGVSEATVLVLADDVVHDVGQQAGHHQDLHVVTLPAVLKVCRNL